MENKYEIIKISDKSWRIEDGVVRTFLFEGSEKALLVDTGFGSGNIKDVASNLTSLPIILVNTHADEDHVGGNSHFESAYMHTSEFAYYFNQFAHTTKIMPLRDGDVIDLGDRIFEVILLPGHTPGSIALLNEDEKIIITGDTVSDTPVFLFGEIRNLNAYIDSLGKLLSIRNSYNEIYPSHGTCPLDSTMVEKLHEGATLLLDGKLLPQKPPFEVPANMYVHDGALFLF